MARISLRSCIWLVESDLLPHVLIADEELREIAAPETSSAEAPADAPKDRPPPPFDHQKDD
jgi:hypothetical protein